MDKSGFLAVIAILAVVMVLGNIVTTNQNLFSISAGTTGIYMSCNEALAKYYNGAAPGECTASATNANPTTFRNAPQTLWYIESVSEKQTPCSGGITPACPTGTKSFCSITVSKDWSKILGCTSIPSPFGELDCTNGYCDYANAVDVPSSCSQGETLCLSPQTYVSCLSNGKFSGKLICSSSTSCVQGRCRSQSEIDALNNNGNNNGGTTPEPNPTPIPVTYWVIGIGAVAAVLLLKK